MVNSDIALKKDLAMSCSTRYYKIVKEIYGKLHNIHIQLFSFYVDENLRVKDKVFHSSIW